ncbi:MAG: peptide chain release factor N(5)-glutamine methyltransferase [Pseudomonadota bacterium]
MNQSLRETLGQGISKLRDANVPDPARDARLLLADALQIPIIEVGIAGEAVVPKDAALRFDKHISERAAHRPVSQIVGLRWFWGRQFIVSSEVLDPRPETELIVEMALGGPKAERILDLGTGSGALLLTLLAETPGAVGIGVDKSRAALGVARGNALRQSVADRAMFVLGDWCDAIGGQFDLVVCNPPYIPLAQIRNLDRSVRDWEPHSALSEGPTGCESYERIVPNLPRILRPGGRALFEIGEDQSERVPQLLREVGLTDFVVHSDLADRPRCLDISR